MQLELFLFHYSFYVVTWVLYLCLNSFSDKDIWSFWSLLLRNKIQIVLKFLEFLLNWDLLYISARLRSSIHPYIYVCVCVWSIYNISVQPRQHIKNQRHYFVNTGPSSQSFGFSSGHVWMWGLDYKESWVQNWCFWTVVLEKTLESPLDCEETQPVHPKGDRSWVFVGRTDAEAEILWPLDAKSWLIGKDPDPGKDWGQEEKGMTEDEMVEWHHWLNGHGFGWTLGVGDGQGGLMCCHSWGRKESDTTEQLNWLTCISCKINVYIIWKYMYIMLKKLFKN